MKKTSLSKKNLTVEEKKKIIVYCLQFPKAPHARVAKKFAFKFKKLIARKSIANFISQKAEIDKCVAENVREKNVKRDLTFKIINAKLMERMRVIESKGGVLSDKILLIKAYEIAKNHSLKTFKGSSSRLDKFKARKNIREYYLEKVLNCQVLILQHGMILLKKKCVTTGHQRYIVAMRQLYFIK
ncbi:hypothetical protein CDIK_3614 [Cucumispora dikerogammari]|nr:hypothetical protein CDIK_3614 [Cucumispora dikerogammari]